MHAIHGLKAGGKPADHLQTTHWYHDEAIRSTIASAGANPGPSLPIPSERTRVHAVLLMSADQQDAKRRGRPTAGRNARQLPTQAADSR